MPSGGVAGLVTLKLEEASQEELRERRGALPVALARSLLSTVLLNTSINVRRAEK